MSPPKAVASLTFTDPTTTSVPSSITDSPIVRSLLSTNGSVTTLLETFFGETVHVVKISEKERILSQDLPSLTLPVGSSVLDRAIVLKGVESGAAYMHAQSTIALPNLCPEFRDSLLKTHQPIGKLWNAHRTEVFKEMLEMDSHPAGELANFLGLTPTEPTVSRTYRVFSDKKCTMLITETFPQALR